MSEVKKYELIEDDKINWYGRTLYRIRALIDFTLSSGIKIKKCDLGGYIEKEDNLSHKGNAWVCNNAKVYGDAWVGCDALVRGDAKVYGNARVYDNALVCGDAWVCGDAKVYDNALVCGDAWVCCDAKVRGDAKVYGNARVYDNALVCDNARVCGNAKVRDNAWVCGNAKVRSNAWVGDNAKVYGNARVYDNALVCGDAEVRSNADYICIKGLGRFNRDTTFYKCKNGDIGVVCGCFNGNLDEFIATVKDTHKDSKYAKEYLAAVEVVKIHFGLEG